MDKNKLLLKAKKNYKSLLILLVIIIVPLFALAIIPFASVVVPSRFGTIDYTWIAVSVGEFEDIHTNDGQGRFYVSKGGYQLVDFDNEGIFGVDNATSTVYYRASAVFRFGINAYTLASITDAFPNINLNARETKDYVEIYKYPSINVFCTNPSDPYCKFNELQMIYADINYRTIDFDTTVANVKGEPFSGVDLRVHDYDGNLPITVQLHEDFGTVAEMEVAEGLTFYNPTMIAEVKKVIVDVTREDVVGDYSDVYKNEQSDFGEVSIYFPETTLASLGSGDRKADVTQTIQDMNLGCRLRDRNEGLTVLGGKTGQDFIRAEPVGTIFDNLETTPSYSFDLEMRIKPAISYSAQNVDVRWAQIEWDYQDFPFNPAGVWVMEGPRTDVYPRYPSVHVTNRYVHQEFNVEVNFIASMQFDPVLGGVILEDPFVRAGDFIWDESLMGTSDYTIVQYTPLQDLTDYLLTSVLPIVILIAIIGVGIYIFIQVGIPLIAKKKATKMIREQ